MQRRTGLTLALAVIGIVLASGTAIACHDPFCIEKCGCGHHGVGFALHELTHHAEFGGFALLAGLGGALVVSGRRVRN